MGKSCLTSILVLFWGAWFHFYRMFTRLSEGSYFVFKYNSCWLSLFNKREKKTPSLIEKFNTLLSLCFSKILVISKEENYFRIWSVQWILYAVFFAINNIKWRRIPNINDNLLFSKEHELPKNWYEQVCRIELTTICVICVAINAVQSQLWESDQGLYPKRGFLPDSGQN